MIVRVSRRPLLLFAFVIAASPAFGGGIDLQNVRLNDFDLRMSPALEAGRTAKLCYSMSYYHYSGRDEREYMIILFVAPGQQREQAKDVFTVVVPPAPHCVPLPIPRKAGRYELRVLRAPLFTRHRIRMDGVVSNTLTGDALGTVRNHVKSMWNTNQALGTVVVKGESSSDEQTLIATYLQLNGKAPAYDRAAFEGQAARPARFSWFSKPERPDLEYRYRFYPDDADWSPWGKTREYELFFAAIGEHTFMVQTRYGEKQNYVTLRNAEFRFVLQQPFVAAPPTKAGVKSAQPSAGSKLVSIAYRRSRALLIGSARFEDHVFPPLNWVPTDLTLMETALKNVGFAVTTVKSGKRGDVLAAIDQFASGATEDERVLVYISSHGFPDPLDPNAAYIATSDCRKKTAVATCISLNDLDGRLNRVLESRGVRHFLLVVDACASGIGALTKAAAYPEARVAQRRGFHILSAGTAGEEAQATRDGRMSVFTKHMVDALGGAADYVDDDVVSLSELAVYVRWNVSNDTKGAQIPMLARMRGTGEMVFINPPKKQP